MKFLTTISLLFTALAVSATPATDYGYKPPTSHKSPCLSASDASKIINRWTRAFAGDVTQVPKVAAPGIKAFDNSINFLFGLPVDTPYIDGIESFKQVVQFNAAGNGGVTPTFTIVHKLNDCTSISFRWTLNGVASGTQPAVDDCGKPSTTKEGDPIRYSGIDIMIVDPKTKKVTMAYSAFDALNLVYLSGLRTCFKKGADGLPDTAACTCPGSCPVQKFGGT